jgi:hypothetical protein
VSRAERKFVVGESVHMTPAALVRGLDGTRYPVSRHGAVQAVQGPLRVKVRRDGRKCSDWYHIAFWTPCRKSRQARCRRLEGGSY